MHPKNRLSILCPSCRRLISRDVDQCPYCGTTRPGSIWKNNLLVRGLLHESDILRVIIYTNIVMYVLSLLFKPSLSTISMNPFYFLSPDNKSLFFLGATGAIPVLTFGRWWSLVTANFLHGSILHIVFNMIALKQLAPLVLTEYGTHRMIVIYLVSGVLGFLLSCLAGVSFTIGASASVCGLMGAILYFGKSRGGVYGQAVYGQIGGWVISLFVFGFIVPGINNWGHGGGLLAGILLGYLLGYKGRRPETQTHKVFAIICVLVTAAFLIWAVLSTMLSQVLTR